jgi:hypothetical protein
MHPTPASADSNAVDRMRNSDVWKAHQAALRIGRIIEAHHATMAALRYRAPTPVDQAILEMYQQDLRVVSQDIQTLADNLATFLATTP